MSPRQLEDLSPANPGVVTKCRGWLRRFWGAEGTEAVIPSRPESEVGRLLMIIDKLKRGNQQQQNTINYLKEINHRLQEKSRLITDFVSTGALHQHQQQQEHNLEAVQRLNQDLTPILDGLEESDSKVISPERLAELRGRTRQIETKIVHLRTELSRQRRELMEKLQEKELALHLQESDMENISATNRQLQHEIRKLRIENLRYKEAHQEREQLQKRLRETENRLQILTKKYQTVLAEQQLMLSSKGLAQENTLLKKTVAHLKEKLRLLSQQMTQLRNDYEKLLEEYEHLFQQF